MPQNSSSSFDTFQTNIIGEILQEAGLISPTQFNIALKEQSQSLKLKIGEILALRGWLKKETVDFLTAVFIDNKLVNNQEKSPIGQYFKEAGLLTDEQINTILKQQKQLGIKFCQLAMMKGFLHQKTADFFLDNIRNKLNADKDATLILENYDIANNSKTETLRSDYTLFEVVKDEKKITNPHNHNSQEILSSEMTVIHDSEIEYSPIWIDI